MNSINVSHYSPNPVKTYFLAPSSTCKMRQHHSVGEDRTLRMDRAITNLKFQSYPLLDLVFVVQGLKNPF